MQCGAQLDLRGEVAEQLPQALPELHVGETAVRVEVFLGMTDRYIALHHACSDDAKDLAQLGLGPHPAVRTGRRAHDGDGLVPQRVVGKGPRGPVERVLQQPWQRAVVFRRRNKHCVGRGDAVAQVLDAHGGALVLDVLVVGRDLREPVVELQLDAIGCKLSRAAQERSVRVLAQAARDGENAHRSYASLISSSSAISLTSLPTTSPPPGSSAFQFTPNSVRSTTVSSV